MLSHNHMTSDTNKKKRSLVLLAQNRNTGKP